MRSKNLIILVVLAAVLGGYILFVERHKPTTEEIEERADRVFPDIDREAIVSLELTTSHGRFRLAKTDGEWRLVEPMDWPADPTAVEALLASIANLDVERTLELGEVSLADHGLDPPGLGLVMIDAGDRRFELAVGNETPLGSKRAVRRSGDDAVLLTSDLFVDDLDRELDQWRSRDVVDVFETGVASIEIDAEGDRIHLVRTDERWQLLEPLADLGDRDQVRSLISELNSLRVSEFLAPDSDLVELGLDAPSYRVLIVRSDGGEPITLELGAVLDSGGAATVACRRNGADIFRVPDSLRVRLSKAPVLWRSPKVWPLSTWDVKRMTIAGADREVVLESADGLWRLEGGAEAVPAAVRKRLNALADLEVREFDLLLPPTRVTGSVVLELEGGNGIDELTYTFYAPLEEGGHAVVTVSARDNVMGIDAAVVESIVGDLDDLTPEVDESPAEE
jgi:hypothetical protein